MPRVNGRTTRDCLRLLTLLSWVCSVLLLACAAPASRDDDGATETGAAGADGVTPKADDPDWCAARSVLEAKCQRCHRDPTENGAPFALLTYADTQVADRNGTPRSEKMKDAIESDYMPPNFLKLDPEVELLTTAERTLLLTWLSNHPPLDAATCD